MAAMQSHHREEQFPLQSLTSCRRSPPSLFLAKTLGQPSPLFSKNRPWPLLACSGPGRRSAGGTLCNPGHVTALVGSQQSAICCHHPFLLLVAQSLIVPCSSYSSPTKHFNFEKVSTCGKDDSKKINCVKRYFCDHRIA